MLAVAIQAPSGSFGIIFRGNRQVIYDVKGLYF